MLLIIYLYAMRPVTGRIIRFAKGECSESRELFGIGDEDVGATQGG